MTKECRACGEVKPLDAFYLERRGLYGRRSRCIGCMAEEMRQRRLKDPDGHRKRKRQSYLKNREAHYAYTLKYRAEHPERWRRYRARRLEMERSLSVTDREYREILRADPCSYCGAPAESTDHIDALARDGDPGWENLTASCRSCNASKGTAPLIKFLLRAA